MDSAELLWDSLHGGKFHVFCSHFAATQQCDIVWQRSAASVVFFKFHQSYLPTFTTLDTDQDQEPDDRPNLSFLPVIVYLGSSQHWISPRCIHAAKTGEEMEYVVQYRLTSYKFFFGIDVCIHVGRDRRIRSSQRCVPHLCKPSTATRSALPSSQS